MALFTSTQSGDWNNPATWGGLGVPDMNVDDAVINDGHEVIVPSGQYVSGWSGRGIAVAPSGTLRVQGGMDLGDGLFLVLGTAIAEGQYLALWGSTNAQIVSGGTLEARTNFYLDGGMMTVDGTFYVNGGFAAIDYFSQLTITGSGVWEIYGWSYVGYDGHAVIEGTLYVDHSGGLDMWDWGRMTVTPSGSVYIYGNLYVSYYSRIDIFGWFGLAEDGWMYLDYEGLVNVYRDIRIGGRVVGYGGKIVMLRREGRIYDFNDNLVIAINRAYGFGQTRIA